MYPASLGRRALLLGAAGTALAGCGSGSGRSAATPSPSSSGPIIHGQDAGTVILDADVDTLVSGLTRALEAGDVRAMAGLVPDLDEAEWRRRLDILGRFPMRELRFDVDRTFIGRQTNASGGALTTDVRLFLIHQLEAADSVPVVQEYTSEVTKADPDAELVFGGLSGPHSLNFPAPWDLPGDWQVLTAPHAVLAFRAPQRAVAERWLEPLSEGIGRAMAMVPTPAGVTRLLVAMDEPDSPLFLRDQPNDVVRDRGGFAARAQYLDPDSLTAETELDEEEGPRATSRIVVHPGMITSDADAVDLGTHEAAHALAGQWGLGGDTWAVEGFAMWVESGGGDGLMRRSGSEIRAAFSSYRGRMRNGAGLPQDVFQKADAATVHANYVCSGAVLAYLEATHGREQVIDLVRRIYDLSGLNPKVFRGVGARDLADLLARTEAWL